MSDAQNFRILLYYKYVPLLKPEAILAQQKELCTRLDLKGRIIVSAEGINGTVAGSIENTEEYMRQTAAVPEFADMEWKVSFADKQVFPKLKVKLRDEIVTLGIKRSGKDVSIENKANYIEPEELRELYDKNEDFVIIDARNLYEVEIGKFKNAVVPPIDNFRDFPEFVKENLEGYKEKEVVTYCTGGVRCEKASAFLREQGFKKVRQLHGGIHEYGVKAGGKHFEGEMFVFDERLHVPVNEVNPSDIAACLFCQKKVSRYIDCTRKGCPELFICCEECQIAHSSMCSKECEAKESSLEASQATKSTATTIQKVPHFV